MVIPTIQQLQAQIIARIESELNVTIPTFGVSYLRAVASVWAGVTWLLFTAIGAVQKNIFVDTCDEETLLRFGQVKINRGLFPAIQAQYEVLLIGSVGAVVPSGTTFRANDDATNPEQRYILDYDYTLDGINLITVRALESGLNGKQNISDQLTAESPIALVESVVTIQTEIVTPANSESIEDYRNVVIQSFRLEPQGGSSADYRLWSLEVQNIVNAYPYASFGNTSVVDLYLESSENNGVPTMQDLENVEDNIELPTLERPSRKPITAVVNYLPVTTLDVDIEVTGFVGIDVDIENLIFSALEAKFSKIRPFVGAIDIVANRNDYFDADMIIQTILEVKPGAVFGAVQIEVNSSVVSSFTFQDGDIPFLNSVTYV